MNNGIQDLVDHVPSAGNGESGEFNSPNSPDSPTMTPSLAVTDRYFPEGLIADFVDYCHHQLETPEPFVVAAALAVGSIVLGRNVWFEWGDERYFPNLYQVLIGDSGATRRSGLLRKVNKLVDELAPGRKLAEYTSPQRLVECFAETPARILIYDEGNVFFGQINRNPALAELITALHDCGDISSDYKKDKRKPKPAGKGHGQKAATSGSCAEEEERNGLITAKETFLTIILGIPPKCFRLNDTNQVSGFMGRLLTVSAERRSHDILEAPKPMPEQWARLSQGFARLGTLQGQMALSPEAHHHFIEVVQKGNRLHIDDDPPPAVLSNLTRMPFNIVRVAMIYQVTVNQSLEISLEALQLAEHYVELCHRCYIRFFHEMGPDYEQKRLYNRIIETLRSHGGRLSHSELLNRTTRHGQWNAKLFKAALHALTEQDLVRFVSNAKTHFPDISLVSQQEGPNASNGVPPSANSRTGKGTTSGKFDPSARYVAQEKQV